MSKIDSTKILQIFLIILFLFDYPFGIRFTTSDYPFGILDLRLLITPLVP
jgi:hypothetical protein